MAKTYPRALGFTKRLAAKARRSAQAELLMMEKFAAKHLNLTSLKPWDISYVMDKYKAKKFGYTQSELHQYLPYQAVFKTLADTIWRLFRVRLSKDHNFRTYHPDVVRYRVTTAAGKLLGYAVVDLFARPMKQTGAWVSKDTSRRIINGRMRVPVANCTCNFTPPDKNGQSYLTPGNFHTLFHEFGHIMNHILSDVVESSVSGTSNVERDALELPSQWLARFSTEPSVLKKISDHGARALPLAAQKQIINSTKLFKGWYTMRKACYSLYDLSLHHIAKPKLTTQLKHWRVMVRRYEIMRHPDNDRTPNAFEHLFSGSYAAGFYSYLWAEVMAADAFKPFRNNPQLWAKLGKKFAREILGPGGSRPAGESFRRYRGRQPKIAYLLEDYGLK
jgi:oligopeptidase A